MIGALLGDMIGCWREFARDKQPEAGLWVDTKTHKVTDDSLLCLATALALAKGGSGSLHRETDGIAGEAKTADFAREYRDMYRRFPIVEGSYGLRFIEWATHPSAEPPPAYDSCGNGSAMRVAPVGWWAQSVEECLRLAQASAECTHNHPEGIKGAQATALAIFLARGGGQGAVRERASAPLTSKPGLTWREIRAELKTLGLDYEPLAQWHEFDAMCQITLRLAWHILDHSHSFEEAVLKAVTLPHADSDTLGCIVGSIAEALWGIPPALVTEFEARLQKEQLEVWEIWTSLPELKNTQGASSLT
jgi:ADP-ribosylglycohydrolase